MTLPNKCEDSRRRNWTRSESGIEWRAIDGGARDADTTHVLHVPRLEVIFQRNGLPRRVEWLCSESAGPDCCPSDQPWSVAENVLSVTVHEPKSRLTDVDLDGLVLVDRGAEGNRRIVPYRITDLLNNDQGVTTTHSSVLAYSIHDPRGSLVETRLTRVTASFVRDSSLRLFFLYSDVDRNPGRISVVARAADLADALDELEPIAAE